MNFLKLTCCLLFLLQANCASIMKEDWEELDIETQPPGAVVTISNGQVCHTPCSLELERGENYSVTITKPGYQTETHQVSGSSWDGWLWGNLAFIVAFPIAIGVDFYTGYAYDFSPDLIKRDLKSTNDSK